MRRRALIRQAEAEGWRAELLGSGHYRLSHPAAARAIIVPATPSDHRADKNARAAMKRALKVGGHPVHALKTSNREQGVQSVSARPKRRPRQKPEPARPPIIMTGTVREQGTRRMAGHVGGLAVDLVLEEGAEGRRWRVTMAAPRP